MNNEIKEWFKVPGRHVSCIEYCDEYWYVTLDSGNLDDLHTVDGSAETLEEALVTAVLAFYRTKCGGI